MLSPKSIVAALLASALVAALAVSSQSYWIDEALSLIVAQAPSPSEAWKYMQAVSGSTLQMPLYQLYLYAWHKIFGDGEWIMRTSNVPWFVIAQAAFLFFLRDRPRLALTACLLAAVSPMLWSYLDETRPYIMQYSAACWLVGGLASAALSRRQEGALNNAQLAAVCAAFFVLFSSSLLGAVWAVCFAAAFLWLYPWKKSRIGDWRFRGVAGLLLAMTLLSAGYYLLTWAEAKRGYHLAGASPLSLPLIAYDMLGFSGLGPGKAALRAEPVAALVRTLPQLVPLAVVLCGLAAVGTASIRRQQSVDRRVILSWLLALALPAAVIVSVFFLRGHQPLPRHFVPALPAVVLSLAAVMNLALARRSFLWRACAIALPVLWLASSLSLRWQPVHAKEDYREAAAIAATALRSNKQVWWAADPAAAHVYLTPIALEKIPGRAWATQAPAWDKIRHKFPPDVIVLSRPDVYDPTGAVARYARENNLSQVENLTGFVIFTRQGIMPEPR